MKKRTIFFLILVPIILITSIVVLNNMDYDQKYIITTGFGDRFLFLEKDVSDFLIPTHNVKVFDINKNTKPELILELKKVKDGRDCMVDFYMDNEIKCYMVNWSLLYQMKGEEYQLIQISDLNKLNVDNNKFLVPVVRKLFRYKWYYREDTSEFLIKSGDEESIGLIKRYANGEFNKEELESIKLDAYSVEELQEYFFSLTQKYKLKEL